MHASVVSAPVSRGWRASALAASLPDSSSSFSASLSSLSTSFPRPSSCLPSSAHLSSCFCRSRLRRTPARQSPNASANADGGRPEIQSGEGVRTAFVSSLPLAASSRTRPPHRGGTPSGTSVSSVAYAPSSSTSAALALSLSRSSARRASPSPSVSCSPPVASCAPSCAASSACGVNPFSSVSEALASLASGCLRAPARGMASLSKAEQHRKRMRKMMDKRMLWKPPNVSTRYLRAEADFNVLSVQRPRVRRGGDEGTRGKAIVDFADGASLPAAAARASEAGTERRLLKPHEVAKLVASHEKVTGTRDDKTTAASLRRGHLPSSSRVPQLTARDVDFQKRPEAKDFGFGAAERVFGAAGLYKENDADYYRRFFKDRYRRLDGKENEASRLMKSEAAAADGVRKPPKQRYIPPKKYWYRDNYCSPLPSEVRGLPSLTLKFALMNEARLVKTGRVPLNLPLWRAFEARLLQLASPRTNVRAATLLRALHAMSKVHHPVLPATVEGTIRGLMFRESSLKPQHYVFLYQALARLRYRHVYLVRGLKEMMLSWSVLRNNFLIKAANAICKLDLADHILVQPLRTTLATRIPNFSAGNCRRLKWITVLNLFSDSMTLAFLRVCHKHENVFKDYSRNLQLIELFLRLEKPEVYAQLPVTTQFFLECLRKTHTEDANEDENESDEESDEDDGVEEEAPQFSASSLLQPDQACGSGSSSSASSSLSLAHFLPIPPQTELLGVSASVPESAANTSLAALSAASSCAAASSASADSRESGGLEEASHATPAPSECRSGADDDLVPSPTSSASHPSRTSMALAVSPPASRVGCTYTSPLHQEVSHALAELGVDHSNSVLAGPLRVDMFHAASQTVIETCPVFQFYANSVSFTALSKRRHQLLLAMGFNLVLVPHQRWDAVKSSEEKKKLLLSLLPPHVLRTASHFGVAAPSQF
ncbi:RAP domain-containing protein [Besnoitia besnoiti]|uniref:RAP domain-containing protein n=1 Tax=Besnoitia besnoiti TaxID=94643 RepID=A0A2A9M4I7_BESBE|nr:RAP domain-containing protein [Besnoitia besnoiti]PFH32134.1 RAP domain-containing protein [Besnoitia besnoiti]